MVALDEILNQVINNFDFAFMIVVNVLTYLVIKVYESIFHKMNKWAKRVVLVGAIALIGGIALLTGEPSKRVLLNSAVLAPVFYSWILKPILEKFGIGYIKIDLD